MSSTPPGRYLQIQTTMQSPSGDVSPVLYDLTVNVGNQPPSANAGSNQVVEQSNHDGTPVTLDGSGSTDDGLISPLTYTWKWGNGGSATGVKPTIFLPLGKTTVNLTVFDGQFSSTDTVDITIQDTTPPTLICPKDVTVEQTNLAGTPVKLPNATATDICDANVKITSDAPAVFPLGVTKVTFTATDASGNRATGTTNVTVQDTTPPTITDSGKPKILWPPNHKYQTVSISDFVSSVKDICDAGVGIKDVKITSVSSDEPENAPALGDGNTLNDIVIKDPQTVDLRAERQGNGNGRVYTINYKVTDASGNTATGSSHVWVPHDISNPIAIDDGAAADTQ